MNNDSLELIDIKSMDEAQLQAYFEQLGEKKFRASQVYQWLHQKLVTDFDQMKPAGKFKKNIKRKLPPDGTDRRAGAGITD